MYAPSPYTYSHQGGGWGPGHGGGGPPAHLHLSHSSRPLFFTLYIRFMYIIPSKPQLYSFGVGRGRGHAKKPVLGANADPTPCIIRTAYVYFWA